ncbi:MAG: DegT/DnrJ/EryC1/StrS aminotransferase [Cytophagales bacterium]|jgi:8-amino-3,8-dideoxy-alpha-D-manno-octulosonate transaminase|nr:DegT/DnrJ/EryC1/StrS family aminotransferase [Bacteroidota bacterium]MBS1979568.1 DegT/DnrJ/EryC1/StrS family aminotransferase [Bacteroidota bacterium]WHZ09231.1 MAG: DegT/DnrJ/EryC1/StrS aminotransferase [Cytophagales bacterium]
MPGTELFGKEEKKEINDVLETGILFRYNHEAQRNNIWKAREFEAEVKKLLGAKYAHAVSSGSTAVACALAGAGVGAGDEVIVPPFTFIASVEAVLFAGALPVFAEIDETLCLSAKGIKAAITPKTKAVLLVHMCGGMAQMDEILAVCKEHNLTLVEDAGQAFAASYKGTSVGLMGKTGCYSFDFFKVATCGEGGVMVTNDEQVYNNADCYSDHGHSHVGNNRGMEPHPILGFNFRIGELSAAVGLAQTRKVPYILEKNREHKKILMDELSKVHGVSFSKLPDPSGDTATFLNLLLPNTETAKRVVDEFNKAGVAGFNYWFSNMYHFINQWDHIKNLTVAAKLPIHILGAPQDYKNLHLPKSQEVVGRLISFGIRCTWTHDEVKALAKKIGACVEKAMAVHA